MNKFNPDTYCGIYCGACSIVMHGETGRTDEFSACLESIPKEEFVCGGCKSDTVYAGCKLCSLRPCALEKGVEHCIDCVDYPCKMYRKWNSMAKFLPHIGEALSSLELIKRDGVDPWLAAQKKRWSCPSCGSSFSWYASICHNCGQSLLSETHRISGWKKLVSRFVLPMVYRKGKAKKTLNN
jgi:predicted amidophosphoribosyltransferase